MNSQTNTKASHFSEKGSVPHPRVFRFIDKNTGTQRFEVEAHPVGNMPVDMAAYLLVVDGLIRNKTPNDLVVIVPASEKLQGALNENTRMLLSAYASIQESLGLTTRGQEVLRRVQQTLPKEEIGMRSNLSPHKADSDFVIAPTSGSP